MVTLKIRDLDETVRDALKARAEAHVRSLNSEVLVILNSAAASWIPGRRQQLAANPPWGKK